MMMMMMSRCSSTRSMGSIKMHKKVSWLFPARVYGEEHMYEHMAKSQRWYENKMAASSTSWTRSVAAASNEPCCVRCSSRRLVESSCRRTPSHTPCQGIVRARRSTDTTHCPPSASHSPLRVHMDTTNDDNMTKCSYPLHRFQIIHFW